jgi:superoxide dismutase, Cu-Zn family
MTLKVRVAAALMLGAAVACTPPRIAIPGAPSAPSSTAPAATAPLATATATLRNLTGNVAGTIRFQETPHGMLVSGTVTGLGLGAHGFHIHAVGRCDPPFDSAGGHHNPGNRRHGLSSAAGPHAGDLPNLVTPAAGSHSFEVFTPFVTLTGRNAILDADGASVVVHVARDDHASDPAGDAGGRMACGVIQRN